MFVFFQPLVKFKSHLYYEEKDPVAKGAKQLEPCKNSKIVLFKNGKCQGVAFEDILGGAYYPAISLYKTASVTVNFGPDFEYPPQDCDAYKPMSEVAEGAIVDHTLCDVLYHVENEGQMPEF
ncbi:Set1/Ash2 histone methyltransferase complex subunit ASH2 [Lamellibrachia satsuma]|nr:Set1/Ash2 histone methyltransferase complex subunit ASH2 [Lamellibrachia satsuma]